MAEEGLRSLAIHCTGTASQRGIRERAARMEKHSKGLVYMCISMVHFPSYRLYIIFCVVYIYIYIYTGNYLKV